MAKNDAMDQRFRGSMRGSVRKVPKSPLHSPA